MLPIALVATALPTSPAHAQLMGPPDPREAQFNQCLDLVIEDPARGVANAREWLANGGSYFALHCLAFAFSKQQRWQSAADSFAQAAQDAEAAKDERSANLWVQAANAALADGQPSTSIAFLDSALISGILEGQALGLAHLDRARALVALGELEKARAEFVLVQKHVPQDPLGWLLSATLERRLDNLERARADINVALSLGPEDPDILVEAGIISALLGNVEEARVKWQQVVTIDAPGPARVSAQEYLRQLAEMEAGEAPAADQAVSQPPVAPETVSSDRSSR
ncbi:tetratricopeptide repeat protein [Alterisphingorhabdus coralli]|uniref:tetratricopeptide repeat protein n=1 Tax=Alterisphingorhabdus coralli TaxID=3071408 RepID=UPI003872EEB0